MTKRARDAHVDALPFPGLDHIPPKFHPQVKRVISVRPPPSPVEFEGLCAEFIAGFGPITKAKQLEMSAHVQHLPSKEANPEWLLTRTHRITGSKVGGIAGLTPPWQAASDVLRDLIWPHFVANKACEWGTTHEDDAEAALRCYYASLIGTYPEGTSKLLAFRIENMGAVVNLQESWMAMSPDGLLHLDWETDTGARVTETRLIEYKCPYRHRNVTCATTDDLYPLEHIPGSEVMLPIPLYYYAQVQWGMLVFQNDIMGAPPGLKAEFVVWAPATGPLRVLSDRDGTRSVLTPRGLIQRCTVPYNQEFVGSMATTVRNFWHHKYVPAAVLKERGSLYEGETEVELTI